MVDPDSLPRDGVLLSVGIVSAESQFQPSEGEWPVALHAVPSNVDPVCTGKSEQASWTTPSGVQYWALATHGSDASDAEVDAMHRAFDTLEFPPAGRCSGRRSLQERGLGGGVQGRDDEDQETLFGDARYRPAMNFGMIWDSPDKPTVEDAIVEVRARAAADGTVIPDGAEPKIVRHDPSTESRYGSLHVIFEWDE